MTLSLTKKCWMLWGNNEWRWYFDAYIWGWGWRLHWENGSRPLLIWTPFIPWAAVSFRLWGDKWLHRFILVHKS